jgi:CHASE3 domain sensor protein
MSVRTETVSARVEPELEAAAQLIAQARGISLSELIHTLLNEVVEEERSRWLKLNALFGVNQCLPGPTAESE